MAEMTNERRAERALRAVVEYMSQPTTNVVGIGEDPEEWDEVIRDLITDLGHLYVVKVRDPQLSLGDIDWTYDEALRRAQQMFDIEDDEDSEEVAGEDYGDPFHPEHEHI